ncbi:MAG: nodulation protein NfeD, partial [Gammaproteobacteria bacterium]|nr:nodulation protein NfeD [Gammaproteobacteria bacterium]
FEFYNPGTGVGGVAGIICLLLGAYALQMLPVNYAGLALLVVGLGLLAAEAFTPSFGVLGTGGVIAFLVGSLILFDTDLPGYRVSIPIILAMTAATAGLVVFVAGAALRAWRSPVVSGGEALIGAEAIALEDFEGEGSVRAAGEVWHARSEGPVAKGAVLTVTSREGLDLRVEPREDA